MATQYRSIDTPNTLKSALEFLARLHDSGAANTVGKALEVKVKLAIEKLGGNEVNLEGNFNKEITKNFNEVLTKASELRSVIVNHGTSYGGYRDIGIRECADKCADILLDILPKLHCTLYYLAFQVSGSFSDRGGTQWEHQTYKKRTEHDNYLYEWLVNTKGLPSWENSSDTIFPCGFNSTELSDKHGYDLHSVLFEFVDYEDEPGCLPKLLYDLVFAIPLTTAATATVSVLTAAFCRAVTDKKFPEETIKSSYPSLTAICLNVWGDLKRIVPRGATGSNLVVCDGAIDYCKNMLKPEHFDVCVKWLKDNLEGIIQNLQKMGAVCKDWDKNMLEYGEYAGAEPIVDNQQPQQDTPVAEVVGAATNVTSAPEAVLGSAAPGGITVENNDHVAVASSASDEQGSHSNGVGMGGDGSGTVTRPSEPSFIAEVDTQTDVESDTTNHVETEEKNGVEDQEADTAHSPVENGRHSEKGQQDNSQPRTNKGSDSQRGSSVASHESENVASVTAGDTSTITIGSAAGGVAVLGGGSAALYFLNVGGIKTLITGVP
ncbi:secreted antigen 1 [Babesia caballi]|uniref:Secreted antigen 1 n=1 Tax=Babesia caballi TaxID=5871 RepID=A0AAV4LMC6_BABCB|nr:secreted antigen 1 [Babesia caballi]